MANQLQNIAQGMQAFGAGIQGNLPQFQRNQTLQKESQQKQEAIQQASEQAMMEGRTKSAYQDAEMALYHAEQGHFDKVIARGISRLQLLKQIEGADPTDTQLLVQLALGAQNGEKGYAERLQSHLGGIVKDGQVREYLETRPERKTQVVDGKLIYLDTGELIREISASKEGGTDDQREMKIKSLAGMLGDAVPNSRDLATKWVDNVLDVEVLDSGFIRLIDGEAILRGDTENAVWEVPVNSLKVDEEPEATSIGLYGLAGETPGLLSGFKELFGRLGGQVGLPVSEDTLEARQTMQMAGQELVRALQQNPRYSEGERKAIAKEISIAPSVFDSPDSLRSRMRSIDTNLRRRLEQNTATANDPQMPEDARASARESARNISNYLDILQVPEKVSFNELTPDFTRDIDRSTARRIINNLSDEELNNLPDEVYQSLKGKF